MMLGDTPADLKELFPFQGWDEQERLTHVPGRSL